MKRFCLILSLLLLLSCSAHGAFYSDWALDFLVRASATGLLAEPQEFASYDAPISRSEMCRLVMRAHDRLTTPHLLSSEMQSPFSDTALPEVLSAFELGYISGVTAHEFRPDNSLTREGAAKMTAALMLSLSLASEPEKSAVNSVVQSFSDAADISDWALPYVAIMVQEGLISGMGDGSFAPKAAMSVEQAVILILRIVERAEAPTYDPQMIAALRADFRSQGSTPLVSSGSFLYTDHYQKNDFEAFFSAAPITTKAEADLQMESITVPSWHLRSDGTKEPREITLTVHNRLAPIVQTIFEEIYAGSEQFPINYATGYTFRAVTGGGRLSEHSYGTAIDINPEQNFYTNGTSTVGSHYSPGTDPYSIAKFGDCWTAFVSHGFTWGGDAWSGNTKDYMHFSYFGK